MNTFGNIELDRLRTDESALRRELENAGAIFRGQSCRCIFHQEKNPSAGIYLKDGAWHYKCLGCGVGGDIIDVRSMLNKTTVADELRKLRPDDRSPNTPPASKPTPPTIFPSIDAIAATFRKVEAVYKYTNPTTQNIDLAVIRWISEDGKKKFTQCRPVGGGFIMKGLETQNPIYNRARIMQTDFVVCVEGEKCVHALHEAGFVGTTSPAGAMNGGKADWSPLAGKNVTLWPDNDAPEEKFPQGKGVAHMRQVQAILEHLEPPPRLFWVDPSSFDLGVKGDVADLVAACKTSEEKRMVVQAILDEAEPLGASNELGGRLEETIAGKRRSIPFGEFKSLTYYANALIPGTVTCVCGDPGSAKSFLMIQAASAWFQLGIKSCLFELEDDRAYHMQRALAQLEMDASLTDATWIENNPALAREALSRTAEFFDGFGRTLWESPDEMVSLEMLKDWIRRRAEAGYQLIAIDPITAAETEDKPWAADLDFLMTAKTVARRHGCRIVLVTHPKKGGKTPAVGLDSLAGGAAYQRFCHTVLWLVVHNPPKDVRVQPFGGIGGFSSINRGVKIVKARNGRGTGVEIGFNFNPKTLRMEEVGAVAGESKIEDEEPRPMTQEELEDAAKRQGV